MSHTCSQLPQPLAHGPFSARSRISNRIIFFLSKAVRAPAISHATEMASSRGHLIHCLLATIENKFCQVYLVPGPEFQVASASPSHSHSRVTEMASVIVFWTPLKTNSARSMFPSLYAVQYVFIFLCKTVSPTSNKCHMPVPPHNPQHMVIQCLVKNFKSPQLLSIQGSLCTSYSHASEMALSTTFWPQLKTNFARSI